MDVNPSLIGIITATIVIISVLAEVIKFLIQHYVIKKNNLNQCIYKQCVFDDAGTQSEARQKIDIMTQKISDCYSLLNKTGEDGNHLIYFPRILVKQQERQLENQLTLQQTMIERLADIAVGQERLAGLLFSIERTVEKLVLRVEKMLE